MRAPKKKAAAQTGFHIEQHRPIAEKNYTYGELPEFVKPTPGTPPKPPTSNDLVAIRHFASRIWIGPYRIVEISEKGSLLVTPHNGQGGAIVVANGYGDGFSQWKFASEVTVETHHDRQIANLLRYGDAESKDKIKKWIDSQQTADDWNARVKGYFASSPP